MLFLIQRVLVRLLVLTKCSVIIGHEVTRNGVRHIHDNAFIYYNVFSDMPYCDQDWKPINIEGKFHYRS